MLDRAAPLALYLEGALLGEQAKMGLGILRYSPNQVTCVIDSTTAGQDVADVVASPRRAPIVASVDDAARLGAKVMVLGIAPPGGLIPAAWYPDIDRAVALGMNIVNGLHDLLGPKYPSLEPGQWIWDIRTEPTGLQPGEGRARHLNNIRVLMIGTDMAIGKMTAGLEIHRAAQNRGLHSEFVATGQIGITITGAGIPLDAIRVDFATGAVEREVLRYAEADLIVVEGQGALLHPGSTSTLPLLRGACPTHLVLCHRAGQTTLRRLTEFAVPPFRRYAELYEDIAELIGTFPRPKTVAIALNTMDFADDDLALAECERLNQETGWVCWDPIRHGADRILEAILESAPGSH